MPWTARLRVALVAVGVLLVAFVFAPSAGAAPPFADDSFWNTPLPDDAPLDQDSDAYVAELQRQRGLVPSYVNTTRFSTPVYTVAADQPTVPVVLESLYAVPDLRVALKQVPIPANAKPADGTDGHLVVRQPSTDTMWEFWRAEKRLDGWHAAWGGKMKDVSANPGFFTNPSNWGGTATSLPLLGGLIRLEELQAGHIDHALGLGIPESRKGTFSWPAQRTDGTLQSPNAIPEGTRFRLDPSLDLDTIQMAPVVRMIAEAAQRYGIVLRDKAGSVTLYGEDPTPTGTNPYAGPNGWFQGKSAATLMQQFPWAHLQALETKLRTSAPGSAYVTADGVLTVASARNVNSDMRIEQTETETDLVGSLLGGGGEPVVTVTDPAGLDAVGSRCTQLDASSVSCTDVASVDASGSYKADTIRMLAPLPATLSGGDSGDIIYGGSHGGTLNGDDGPDTLVPGTGADLVKGGDGNDRADYRARTTALTLSLDGIANDGAAGEGDNLAGGIEVLIGGDGNDRLTGSPSADSLWAQGGDDVIDGRAGGDWINGGTGTDTADYSSRTRSLSLSIDSLWNDGEIDEGDAISPDIERLVGGSASDTLLGSDNADQLEGRDGNDFISGKEGVDVLRGGDGSDWIWSRDMSSDDVECGDGKKDFLFADLKDQILKRECEKRDLE